MSTRQRKAALTREALDGSSIFEQIQQTLQWLLIGYRPEYAQPPNGMTALEMLESNREQMIGWVPLNQDDVKTLTVRLNTQMKLLSKVLPDLKAIELNDVSETRRYSTEELAQRLASIRGVSDFVRPSLIPSQPSAPSAPPKLDS
jgi:hypothetical protein